MKRIIFFIFIFNFVGYSMDIEILPWNNHKAAVSLTFDDGDPSHIESAIPLLNERGLKGTFFLIISSIAKWNEEERDLWRKASKEGHEIANHTISHPHPDKLNYSESLKEIKSSTEIILKEFGVYPYSFAYPFGEISYNYRKILPKFHISCRGGGADNYYIPFFSNPDWLNIPSQVTLSHLSLETYERWITTALSNNSWTVFMIHGIEGTPWGWEPVQRRIFIGLLDILKSLEEEIWVAPFGEVSAYMQAAVILNNSLKKIKDSKDIVLRWKRPKLFPKGIILKVKAEKNLEFFQKSGRLSDYDGVYSISFDEERLKIKEKD